MDEVTGQALIHDQEPIPRDWPPTTDTQDGAKRRDTAFALRLRMWRRAKSAEEQDKPRR